jgi:hypothetical protein
VHHARVRQAVAVFLVDLHRKGVFWGDCSLANVLFRRDGQVLQPVLVDAETAEVRDSLTDGQRRHDLEILSDNLAGGLLDLAASGTAGSTRASSSRRRTVSRRSTPSCGRPCTRSGRCPSSSGTPPSPTSGAERARLRVDEVRLTSAGDGGDEVRLHTVVAQRRHHATELLRLTGLHVGEGQAAVLLGDLRGHGRSLPGVSESERARAWLEQVLHPAVERLRAVLPGPRDPVQDYCDLLEVRWLLSERAGRDVGDDEAVQELAAGRIPAGAAAELGAVRTPIAPGACLTRRAPSRTTSHGSRQPAAWPPPGPRRWSTPAHVVIRSALLRPPPNAVRRRGDQDVCGTAAARRGAALRARCSASTSSTATSRRTRT